MQGGSNGDNTTKNNGGRLFPVTVMLPLLPTTNSYHHHHAHHHSVHLNNAPFLLLPPNHANHQQHQNNPASLGCYFMDHNNGGHHGSSSTSSSFSIKSKIMAHPHYHRLLSAYINCQKVGAPPEVVRRLEKARETAVTVGHMVRSSSGHGCLGEDPALDQFMEAYCEVLIKYEQEISKPFKETILFLQKIESQFKAYTVSSASASDSGYGEGGMDWNNNGSSDEVDVNNNLLVDPPAEKLKMKKRKKGKHPEEAIQKLFDWWEQHYKWPYPSESEKLALVESTGLNQKQINNWFINQRQRHWKPWDEVQYTMKDASEDLIPFPPSIS